jgi:hypothetical protein
VSEGAEAGHGEDGRPTAPVRSAGAAASAPPPPLHDGPPVPDEVPATEGSTWVAHDLSEDLPTMPPAPGKREPALRWALPEQAPAPAPAVNFPQPTGRPTMPEGHQPAAQVGPTTSPSGSVLPLARSVYLPASTPHPTGPAVRASLKSPSPDVPTQPVPVARPQVMRAQTGPVAALPAAPVTAPGPTPHRRRTVFWLLVIAVIVVASVSAAVVVGGRTTKEPRRSSRISSGEAVFERLLATSTSAGHLTDTAVAQSCQEVTPGGTVRSALLGDLSRAIALRQAVLRTLEADRLQLLAMPEGALLATDLGASTTAELRMDQDYQGWLQDLQATGCYSAPTNDVHYRAAALGSPGAAGADERLAAAWAQLGPAARPRS